MWMEEVQMTTSEGGLTIADHEARGPTACPFCCEPKAALTYEHRDESTPRAQHRVVCDTCGACGCWEQSLGRAAMGWNDVADSAARARGIQPEAILKHLRLLGKKVTDKVSTFTGIVSSVTFDLYGCIQAVVTPCVDKDGKMVEGHWIDVERLTVLIEEPVMVPPSFDEADKGPAEKPAPRF